MPENKKSRTQVHTDTGCQKSRSVGCFLKMSPVSAVWNDTACILGKYEKNTIQPVFRHTVYDFGTSYRTGSKFLKFTSQFKTILKKKKINSEIPCIPERKR